MQLQEVTIENAENGLAAAQGLPTQPPVFLKILDDLGIDYSTFHHVPVFTNDDAAAIHHLIPGLETTNLFLRDKKGRMCLISKDKNTQIDLKALDAPLGFQRFSFGSPERLMENLGVRPGSVNPFAIINDTQNMVTSYLDKTVMDADLVGFHPLINTMTITLKPVDVVRVLTHLNHAPQIIDFTTRPYSVRAV